MFGLFKFFQKDPADHPPPKDPSGTSQLPHCQPEKTLFIHETNSLESQFEIIRLNQNNPNLTIPEIREYIEGISKESENLQTQNNNQKSANSDLEQIRKFCEMKEVSIDIEILKEQLEEKKNRNDQILAQIEEKRAEIETIKNTPQEEWKKQYGNLLCEKLMFIEDVVKKRIEKKEAQLEKDEKMVNSQAIQKLLSEVIPFNILCLDIPQKYQALVEMAKH
ncbi:hypothetical protein TRFO_39602 [Tritrichomonas foetus]|uniref:Uncharacterized protein n=1 Tax=Tritrichomonas foetus TaxID=1144522 RepID=A0A1J4J923_9EUKA|nr:hypothetical protein TRFO_39602 [Tritrichomonas foetus]|eukprot:OHS94179.1 hypothetical protein TRFO_39602 [Tritrichomonas foetus]